LKEAILQAASELLIKGSKQVNGDQASKNKAFLQIADVSYDQKKYLQAARFYDSVQVTFFARTGCRPGKQPEISPAECGA
jgi:hypothetical protein